MRVGFDFSNFFADDLFSVRRNGTAFQAGNPYDPESLMSGEEANAGMTYTNSHRAWPSRHEYDMAVAGKRTTEEILVNAPRVHNYPSRHTLTPMQRFAGPCGVPSPASNYR